MYTLRIPWVLPCLFDFKHYIDIVSQQAKHKMQCYLEMLGIYYWMKIMHHKKVGEIKDSPNYLLNRSQGRSIQWLNMPSCHPCTLGMMFTINFKNMMTQLKQSLLTYLDIEDGKFITKLFISLSAWSLSWCSASFCEESILGFFFNFSCREPKKHMHELITKQKFFKFTC
jgi:hypothetical protein